MFGQQQDRAMEEFRELCTEYHIEAKIEALPNPSTLGILRVITFQNFGEEVIRVLSQTGQSVYLPAKGTTQMMLGPDEPPPTFERIE